MSADRGSCSVFFSSGPLGQADLAAGLPQSYSGQASGHGITGWPSALSKLGAAILRPATVLAGQRAQSALLWESALGRSDSRPGPPGVKLSLAVAGCRVARVALGWHITSLAYPRSRAGRHVPGVRVS